MSAAAIDFTYRYPFASGLGESGHGLGLTLATCGLSHEHPYFFDGRGPYKHILAARLLADGEQESEGEKGP